MIVLQILMLIFWMAVLPLSVGLLPGRWLRKEDRTLTGIWISGYLVLFALFELVGIPVVLLTVYHGFSRLCLLFGLAAGAAFLAGIVLFLKKKDEYESLTSWSFFEKMTVEEWIYLALVILLIGFQVYMAFTRASFDGDDAYYGVQSLIAQQQDTLYRINPNTGRSSPLDIRHAMALMPIYEAFLGKMSGIHATIIAHSVAPVCLILLTYALYFQIGKKLFPEKRTETLRFLILMALFQIFGNVSIYTSETFFLTRTWQGKSLCGNFMIPAIFWLYLCMFRGGALTGTCESSEAVKVDTERMQKNVGAVPEDAEKMQKSTGTMPGDAERTSQKLFFLLAFLNLASGISSSLGVLLTCLLTAGLGLLLAISRKRFGILVKACLSCVLGAVYMLTYLIASHM